MTVRDELEKILGSVDMTREMPSWDDDRRFANAVAAQFLRDHGSALLAMVEAFESDRASLARLISDASVARLALAHGAEANPMYQEAYEILGNAIDKARARL